jgi:trehalose-6-phosphatase
VCVISSEDRDTVTKAFRKLPNIWLAAENGYWYKTDKTDWKRLFEQDSKAWLGVLRKMFDQYCENIEGTVVEERESSITWNYKNAAEEHGLKFSKELYNQVVKLYGQPNQQSQAKRIRSGGSSSSEDELQVQNIPVEVNHGNGFIEVVSTQLRKEKLIQLILNAAKSRSASKIDFLLFIGSD